MTLPERDPEVIVIPPCGDGDRTPRAPVGERTWAMLCHLAALLGYMFPFGHIFGPLAVWLLKGEKFPLVDDQGKEALNFQISITLYLIAAAVLIMLVVGIPLLVGLVIFHFIVVIIASVRAKSGEKYRYPVTIRFLR
jgi:uncharacterized Tic20 family protein